MGRTRVRTPSLKIRLGPEKHEPLSHPRPENRLGVSFGDHYRNWGTGQHWHVTLNGEYVENEVDEALAGRQGWVRFVHGLDTRIVHGDVRAWTATDGACGTPSCRRAGS